MPLAPRFRRSASPLRPSLPPRPPCYFGAFRRSSNPRQRGLSPVQTPDLRGPPCAVLCASVFTSASMPRGRPRYVPAAFENEKNLGKDR